MNEYDLAGRTAVITGGAQGIGFAVVKRMLESGASVSIWDRDEMVLGVCAEKVGASDRVQCLTADIGVLASVEAATKATVERYGKVDILVNNAALVGPNMPTWEYPPEAFAEVVQVGLNGTFHCCRTIVPHMM
ncbi:SDR family NAD(P)-dependent oxidoreductase, partial [Mesorhizobium sp. M7A.F.Ca.US.006.04.2.1]